MTPYAIGGLAVLVLYGIQSEVRFGARARTGAAEAPDRGSTRALSLVMAVPVLGFVLAVKIQGIATAPAWLRALDSMPGMPAAAWTGVGLGVLGLLLRLWAVLVLRERYTRTLLVHKDHAVERTGPYRYVRHPGYLGSLLCLNGVALSCGSWFVFVASLVATLAAYAYRIRVEDEMMVAAFGAEYESYRREVRALLPFVR